MNERALEAELAARADLYVLEGVTRGTARIEIVTPDTFAFREDGRRAFIIPMTRGCKVIDVLALLPGHGQYLRRLGVGLMLGHEALDDACWSGRALDLIENPIRWLEFHHSSCLIDWHQGIEELRHRS